MSNADRPFIVRVKPNKYVQSPALLARFREVHRAVGKAFAGMQVVEHDHWDRSTLKLSLTHTVPEGAERSTYQGRVSPIRSDGQQTHGVTLHVPRSSDGVAQFARRLHDDDLAKLDAIDERIADAEAVVRELRRERKELLGMAAWRRGKRLLVHDVAPEDGAHSRIVTE